MARSKRISRLRRAMALGNKESINLVTLAVFLYLISLCQAKPFSRPLEGLQLRCCGAVQTPILFEDETNLPHKVNGMAMDYLLEMEATLGFRCISLDMGNEDDEGVRFNSVVEKMNRCTTAQGTMRDTVDCNCDMAVGGWFETAERRGKVDFLPPFMIDGIAIAVHMDETSAATDGAFFLKAFSIEVWGLVVALGVTFTLLKMLDRRFVPPDNTYEPLPSTESRYRRMLHFLLKSRILYRLRKAFQSTMSRTVGTAYSDPVETRPTYRHWVLNMLIACFSVFLILAYESSMTAMLVQGKIESKYRTLEDLQNCQVDPRSVCVPEGGAMGTFWKKVVASHKCHKENKDGGAIPVYSYEEGAKSLANKTCKFMLTLISTGLSQTEGEYCGKMAVTGSPCFLGGISFLLPRGSNLTETMADATLQMNRAGKLETPETYLKAKCSNNGHTSLSVKQLRVFFFFSFGTCLALFVVMICHPQAAGATGVEAEAEAEASMWGTNAEINNV